MNLLSVNEIKTTLDRHGTKPSKIMGQNFLIDQKTLNKIIETSELNSKDTILEIGPGMGTLTQELAKRAGQVIAIEKDGAMVEILTENLKMYDNVKVLEGNALHAPYDTLPARYKIVANIPYYLTSPLIRKFLEAQNKPETMVLMIQKEVAQRICANPPNMSLLAVSVQFYATAKIISYVSKENFWPKPKVDSAIIKIIPNSDKLPTSPELFFRVVKAGFLQPRKQLANNLSKGLKKDKEKINSWLLANKINPSQRAETLTIQDWVALTTTLDMR